MWTFVRTNEWFIAIVNGDKCVCDVVIGLNHFALNTKNEWKNTPKLMKVTKVSEILTDLYQMNKRKCINVGNFNQIEI